MSDRIENLESTFNFVERGRGSISEAQTGLDDTYRDHFARYFAAREELFGDLSDGDFIRDGDIVDYAEASMRLDGVDASDASKKADRLAEIFAPSQDAPALPVYFHNGRQYSGDHAVLAVRPAPGSEEGMTFRLLRDEQNREVHDLVVRSEGTPNVFRNGYFSLTPGGGNTAHWTYGSHGTARVNLRGLEITDDPEKANWIVQQNHPTILTGEAAVTAVDPRQHSGHEDVALTAILTGQEPEFQDWGVGQKTAFEQTFDRVRGYAVRLLTVEDGAVQETRERVPVQLHPAVLPLVLSQAEVERAVLEGVADAGDVLSEADTDLIHERVESGKSHRNTGQIIDAAITGRLEVLKAEADAVEVESGLSIEPESLMQAALKNPALYRVLALSRGEHSMSGITEDAIWSYVRGTPRFKGLHNREQ